MIRSFKKGETEKIWEGIKSKLISDKKLIMKMLIALEMLNASKSPDDMRITPGKNVKKLTNTENTYSYRLNDKYRLTWRQQDEDAYDVEISNHYSDN